MEHSYLTTEYTWEKTNAFNTDLGLHYYTTDANNIMRIYNESHSLIKTLDLPVNSTDSYNIEVISDKLFNSDDLIEFVLATTNYPQNNFKLVNENGEILQELGSEEGPEYDIQIIKGSNNNFKLIIYLTSYNSQNENVSYYNVYSLPGTYLEVNTLLDDDNVYIYPNPAKTAINITNPKNGSNELNIFSSAGQLVKSVNFNNEEKITIHINDLPKGIYIIKAGNLSSKFIKE